LLALQLFFLFLSPHNAMNTPQQHASQSPSSAHSASEVHIHPTALVAPTAQLGVGVRIGAFSIVEAGAEIGDHTDIRSSVVIASNTRLGAGCVVHPSAVIGGEPQDLKFKGEETSVVIGERTVIRECATVNRGTAATGVTAIGHDCLIMAYCHVAHDCVVGNHVIMSNVTQLAGHVTLEDYAILGGCVKVTQFCSVGRHAMVGADSKIVKDVAPYLLADGNPVKIAGLNKVGLKRRGFTTEAINELEELYTLMLFAGNNVSDGIRKFLDRATIHGGVLPESQTVIDFVQASKRGIHR
jgi:UDP-N-acetylglucosamine acyltransferase